MAFWAITKETIPQEDLELFGRVRSIIDSLYDVNLGADERGNKCHIISRALSNVFKIRCHDGFFYSRYRHSWVTTTNNNIIDIYPVASFGGPIMYSNDPMSPARVLYKPDSTLCSSFRNESFEQAVRIYTQFFKEKLEGGPNHVAPCR